MVNCDARKMLVHKQTYSKVCFEATISRFLQKTNFWDIRLDGGFTERIKIPHWLDMQNLFSTTYSETSCHDGSNHVSHYGSIGNKMSIKLQLNIAFPISLHWNLAIFHNFFAQMLNFSNFLLLHGIPWPIPFESPWQYANFGIRT